MAEIVLGVASSHSPQLSSTTDTWRKHGERDRERPELLAPDGRFYTYAEILEQTTVDHTAELTEAVWERKYQRTQDAIEALGAELAAAAPDVVLVVGDDQLELFHADGIPAIGIFTGEKLLDLPVPDEKFQKLGPGLGEAMWAWHGDEPVAYRTPAGLSAHLVESLVLDHFDPLHFSEQPADRSLGHAFTFVKRRLAKDFEADLLPIFLNTYVPPNVPTPGRCYALGEALRRAIESWPEDLRVALVASGGLSHFVIDEELDNRVLDDLQRSDAEDIAALPRALLRSGASEILNWLTVGGAFRGHEMHVLDYVPAYRTKAGTGTGMAFATWRP